MRPIVSRALAWWILAVAAVPMLLAGGSLPHTHDDPGVGLYNQEHDLTIFYVAAGAAALTVAGPAVLVVVFATSLIVAAPRRTEARPGAGADSRAPPAR